jgi:Na+/proline symporter
MTAAMLVMVLVWVGQISICGLGLSMSDAHAADDSEGGTLFWFLLSKAAQFGFLGWHSMPIALCSVAQVVRRKEDLLKKRLHATLFWIPFLSFTVAVVLLFIV